MGYRIILGINFWDQIRAKDLSIPWKECVKTKLPSSTPQITMRFKTAFGQYHRPPPYSANENFHHFNTQPLPTLKTFSKTAAPSIYPFTFISQTTTISISSALDRSKGERKPCEPPPCNHRKGELSASCKSFFCSVRKLREETRESVV